MFTVVASSPVVHCATNGIVDPRLSPRAMLFSSAKMIPDGWSWPLKSGVVSASQNRALRTCHVLTLSLPGWMLWLKTALKSPLWQPILLLKTKVGPCVECKVRPLFRTSAELLFLVVILLFVIGILAPR